MISHDCMIRHIYFNPYCVHLVFRTNIHSRGKYFCFYVGQIFDHLRCDLMNDNYRHFCIGILQKLQQNNNSEKWMTGNVLFQLCFNITKQDFGEIRVFYLYKKLYLSVIQLIFWCFIVFGDCKMEIGRT